MCSLSRDFFTVLALLIQKQLFDFYFTHFLFLGMFSLCWPSQSTQCLRVLQLDWRLQAAMSGQCLLPSLPTSTSFIRLSHSQLYQFLKIHHFSSLDPNISSSRHFQIPTFQPFSLLQVRDHLLRQPRAVAGRHQHSRIQPRPHHFLPCQVSFSILVPIICSFPIFSSSSFVPFSIGSLNG